MELKHFRLIKTIAEEGNLARSSDRLFLTQSALSHQLSQLEGQLGFKVFFRKRNQWELTDQGKELYQLANQIFESIDRGFSNIEQLNQGSKGEIKIASECNSFYQGFPAFIQKMGFLYPDIDILIDLEAGYQLIPKLLTGDIDMAIVTVKPKHQELEVLDLYTDELRCVMNAEHELAAHDFVEPSHFADLHLIIHSFPLESVSVLEHYLKPNQVFPRKISAIPFTSVALEMIDANMGVTCLPSWMLDPFKPSEHRVMKQIGPHGLHRNISLVYRKADRNKRFIQEFVENIGEEF